jgi:hypothetical protein
MTPLGAGDLVRSWSVNVEALAWLRARAGGDGGGQHWLLTTLPLGGR